MAILGILTVLAFGSSIAAAVNLYLLGAHASDTNTSGAGHLNVWLWLLLSLSILVGAVAGLIIVDSRGRRSPRTERMAWRLVGDDPANQISAEDIGIDDDRTSGGLAVTPAGRRERLHLQRRPGRQSSSLHASAVAWPVG